MGLLKETKPRDSKPTFAEECARVLQTALKKKDLLYDRVNFSKWTLEFERLGKKRDAETIKEVLDWYASNAGNEFVPEAYSAASFRRKFGRIKKQSDSKPLADVEKTLTVEQMHILKRIKEENRYPVQVKKMLPKLVRDSHRAYVKFRQEIKESISNFRIWSGESKERFEKTKDKSEEKQARRFKRFSGIAEHLIEERKVMDPIFFLADIWFEKIAQVCSRYVMSFNQAVFDRDHWYCKEMMYYHIGEYTNDPELWDSISKYLGKSKPEEVEE